MIEETVLVTKASSDIAWVQVERQSECGKCSAKSGCGTNMLSGYFDKRQKQLPIKNSLNVAAGERVIVGIDEGALVSSALSVYLLPLIIAFISAALASNLFTSVSLQQNELISIFSAIVGFAVTIVFIKRYYKSKHVEAKLQPTMLRKVPAVPLQQFIAVEGDYGVK